MVNEQKAKAYDEALERARKQRDDYQKELDKTDKNSQLAAILRAGISAIELAFPELTESEDEKIRKSLIEFLTDIKEISESGRSVWAVRKEDAEMCKSSIAYLEKQKEQKSVSAEELLVKAGLKHYKDGNMWCIFVGDNIQEGICGFGNTIDEALYQFLIEVLEIQKKPKVDIDKLRRDLYQSGYNDGYQHGKEDVQKKQNSIGTDFHTAVKNLMNLHKIKNEFTEEDYDFYTKELLELVEQKPDWSEDDEKMIKTIIDVLERSSQVTTYEQRGGSMSASVGCSNKYEKEIGWLKDISLNHKKFIEAVDKLWSNEWSDEDENIIKNLIELVEAQPAKDFHESSKDTILKRLKSLRPSWKPSEEQMKALQNAVALTACDKELVRLYNQLKKL